MSSLHLLLSLTRHSLTDNDRACSASDCRSRRMDAPGPGCPPRPLALIDLPPRRHVPALRHVAAPPRPDATACAAVRSDGREGAAGELWADSTLL